MFPALIRKVIPKKFTTLAFLAWRNLWRNPFRSFLTMGAMVVALVMMILFGALMEGMLRSMNSIATDMTVGHFQVHRKAYVDDQELYAVLPPDLVKHLENSGKNKVAPRAYAAALASSGKVSTGVMLQGVNPEKEMQVTKLPKNIAKGAFQLGKEPSNGRVEIYQVVVGSRLAKQLKVGLGGEIVLMGQGADGSIANGLFHVRGILKPFSPVFDRMGILMSLEAFDSLMVLDGAVHELAVKTPDLAKVDEYLKEMEASLATYTQPLPDPLSGGVVFRSWKQINKALAEMLQIANSSMYVMSGIIFFLVMLGLINTLIMSIHERHREFGMLRAIGLGQGGLLLMVMMESLLLSIVAAGVGALLGGWWASDLVIDLTRFLPDGMEWGGITMDLMYVAYLTPEQIYTNVWLMLVLVLAGSFIPSIRVLRLKPADALKP